MHDVIDTASVALGEVKVNRRWETKISPEVEIMPRSAIEQCLEAIKTWHPLFPLANTWVGKEYGAPSLFIRLDCVVGKDGNLVGIYEIEERPCGLGLSVTINPSFKERFERVTRWWPTINWVIDPSRETDDDIVFGPGLTLNQALHHDGKLLVRSRPERADYHPLEDRAVSSVSCEGDKGYGITMGLWHEVVAQAGYDDDGRVERYVSPVLPDACILKPRRGTRCKDILSYASRGKREQLRQAGLVFTSDDWTSAERIAKEAWKQPRRTMYCQPFVMPTKFDHEPDKNGIHRCFFVLTDKGEWECVGGFWMALNKVLVHGTNQTISGPLVVED